MHMDPNNMIKYSTMTHVIPLQITTKYINTSKIYRTYIYKCEYHYIELGSVSMTFEMVLIKWLISYQE
jgi:cytidylate kinase